MSIRRLLPLPAGTAVAGRRLLPALAILPALVAALLLAGCDEDFVNPSLPPSGTEQLIVVGGNNQAGFVGMFLARPLRVQVRDSRGNPLPRQRVEFRTLVGEGVVSPSSAVTDFAGFTQVRFIPFGEGSAVVEASQPGGGASARALFEITAVEPGPTFFQKIAGDNQTGAVGTVLPVPLTVRVADGFELPLANFPVLFTATTDETLLLTVNGGDFTTQPGVPGIPQPSDSAVGRQAVSFTDGNGVAAVLVRLRTRPGLNQVTASTTSPTGSSSAVTFNATGTAGGTTSASAIVKISGDDQNVTFDTTGVGLTPSHTFNPMVVQVTDRFGNPVTGITVFFRVSNGFGGTTPTVAVTDGNGFAQTVYTSNAGDLGGIAVAATAPGVGTVTFQGSITATGTTPVGDTLPVVGAVTGDVSAGPWPEDGGEVLRLFHGASDGGRASFLARASALPAGRWSAGSRRGAARHPAGRRR